MKARRIKTVLIKEFLELFRDRKLLAIVFMSPIVQLIIFGYAATYDVKQIPTGVLDYDRSTLSRELIRKLESSEYFSVDRYLSHPDEIDSVMENGELTLVLQIPHDFSENISTGGFANLGVSIEATNSNNATITSSFLTGLITQLNQQIQQERLQRNPQAAALLKGLIDPKIRIWYNPALESRDFNVPAIVVQILVVVTLLLTSMAIVREKEFGTMEQLIVTPITSAELIIGKALPYAFIGMVDICLITAVAVYFFKVPLVGNLVLLFLTALIFMISTLAIGLLISTISSSQQQAMISAFFFMMPAILLSGFAFPISNMPDPIQYLTIINPLRYFMVIMRAIFLKGLTAIQLLDQIVPLLAIGIVVLIVASLRFRKRTN